MGKPRRGPARQRRERPRPAPDVFPADSADRAFVPEADVLGSRVDLNTGRRALAVRAGFMEALVGDSRVLDRFTGWLEQLAQPSEPDHGRRHAVGKGRVGTELALVRRGDPRDVSPDGPAQDRRPKRPATAATVQGQGHEGEQMATRKKTAPMTRPGKVTSEDRWLGKRLKDVRRYKKVKQARLAKRVGVDAKTLSLIERGRVRAPAGFYTRAERALNLSLWYFSGDGG